MQQILATQNRNIHRPFHIYSGHTYFVTGRMINGKTLMKDNSRKRFFQVILKNLSEELNIGIFAWVVLHNHYHLLFKLNRGETSVSSSRASDKLMLVTPSNNRQSEKLVSFMRRLHASTARKFNEIDQAFGRKVWSQYFDYCIRDEKDFFTHFNYIVKNPLKHKLVLNLNQAYNYPYSSNPTWVSRLGIVGLGEGMARYPVEECPQAIEELN